MLRSAPAVEDDDLIETVLRILQSAGQAEAASILRGARCRIQETGYDNLDGGTNIMTMYVEVAPETYAHLGERKDEIQRQITDRLSETVRRFTHDWYGAEIVPLVVSMPSRPDLQGGPVARLTRSNILDVLRLEGVSWQGALGDVEFLEPVFDLARLPSMDSWFTDAAGDIWQHRENNDDWPSDWLFADKRFDLQGCPDATFLVFVERLVDPVVRPDPGQAKALADALNEELRRDAWSLVQVSTLARRPRYRVEPWNPAHRRADKSLRNAAAALSSAWMHQELERIEAALDTDPALAIGTAKELVETCCKHIADKLELALPANPNMPDLVKAVLKGLKLVPEGISEQAKGAQVMKRTLSNLSQITQGLAELRQLYGSGHGRGATHRGLQPRHARLAVAAAAAFCEFAVATFHERLAGRKDGTD